MTTSIPVSRKAARGGVHFVRFILWLAVSIVTYGGAFVGIAFVLGWVGFRKRDVLMLLIPFVGFFVLVVALWRVTASEVYWKTRPDVPSRTFSDVWAERKAKKAELLAQL
jgi:hypothetical protein